MVMSGYQLKHTGYCERYWIECASCMVTSMFSQTTRDKKEFKAFTPFWYPVGEFLRHNTDT
jgi:hypothetical protein